MSMEIMRELQAYGYFILLLAMVFILYAYWFHLNKSEKTGRRNYEKYSDLVLRDDLADNVLEGVTTNDSNVKGGVKK